MVHWRCLLPAVALVGQVLAHEHHILVGNFGTDYNVTLMLDGTQDVGDGYLYTLLLDADKKTLDLVATSKAQAAHPWLSLNKDANVVYGSGWSNPVNGTRTFSSYKVQPEANYSVTHLNTVKSCGTKPIANDFVQSYGEHGVFYGVDFVNPCGEVWTVNKDGSFEEKVQNLTYGNGSTLHGFVESPDLKFMYIMDLGGNAVHAYTAHKENGTLSPLQDVSPAEAGSGPRHAVIPPSQEYFYVIEEEALLVQQFGLDKSTGKLNATGNSLPVTPFGLHPDNATAYWGDEVVLSSSGSVLYSSTRARNGSFDGYISGYSLNSDGSYNDTLFTIPTPSGGGTSNILSASPWHDDSKDMLILTDQDADFVALYELQGDNLVLLDRVNISGTNCCSGSVWLN